MRFKILFTTAINLLLFTITLAKTGQTDAHLIGDVKSAETGQHLPYLSVTLKGTTIGTLTDATGHFFLKNLPLGKYTVKIHGIGYQAVEREVEMFEGKTIEYKFDIKEDAVQLNEVVVSANRNEISRKNAPIIVGLLSPKVFEASNSVCLAQGLCYQPGLRVESNCQNCGFQQVRINGLEGHYSQILLDSRPIFSALSGVYGIEQIPVSMIERVEVVRGGGSALFGSNAIAGTINIITKDPQINMYQLSHNYTAVGGKTPDNSTNVSSSIVSDDRVTGLYLFGSFRNRAPYDHNTDSFSELGKIRNNTFGFRGYYRLSDYSKLTLEFHNLNEFRRGGNKFNLQPHQTDITEQAEHQINGGSVGYNWYSRDFKDKVNIYSSVQHINRSTYYGAAFNANAYGATTNITTVNGSQYVHGFDNLLFMPSELTLGAEHQYDALHDQMPGYNRNIKQTTNVTGVFLQNEWKTNKLSLLAGARLDKHNLMKTGIVSPRVNIKYSVLENLQTRLSYSTGFRAPQAFDEDLHILAVGGQVMLIQIDPNLKAERSYSYSASADFDKEFGNTQTDFLVEAFYTKLNNVFVLREIGTDVQGNKIVERGNGSGAVVKGLNFEAKVAPSNILQFQAGFTVQQSTYQQALAWSNDPTVTPVKTMLRSPNNYGFATLLTKPVKNMSLSFTGTYTGTMLTPHYAGYIPADQLKQTPVFFDCNIKIAYNIKLPNNVMLQINSGVQNMFNSYQNDFDSGSLRDAGYMYGPSLPRSWYVGIKIGNLLI